MQTRSELIKNRLIECIHNGELDNPDLVQIFEHVGKILNLKTLSNYAKDNGITYNGAKIRLAKQKPIIIDDVEFYIDNF